MKKWAVMIVFAFILPSMAIAVSYPLTVVDDVGNAVTFGSAPERVVDAAPSVTDFMIKLGYSDRVVGVTKFDSYAMATDIGLLYPLNLEKIISLKPDLVLLFGGFQLQEYDRLARLGLKTFVLNADSLEGVYRDIVNVAIVMGDPQRGKNLVESLKKRVDKVALEAYNIPMDKRPTVFYGEPGNEIWTAGTGSLLNQVISLAGGMNVAGSFPGPNGWLPVGPEFVVSRDPDIVLTPYYTPEGATAAVKAFKEYPAFKDLRAVKEGRVYAIDGNITSEPNTKIVDILEQLYGIFGK